MEESEQIVQTESGKYSPFTESEKAIIKTRFSDFEKDVFDTLALYATEIVKTDEKDKNVNIISISEKPKFIIGDDLYNYLKLSKKDRPTELKKLISSLVPEKSKGKVDVKLQVPVTNTVNQRTKEYDAFNDSVDKDAKCESMLKSEYIEFIGIGFLYLLNKNHSTMNKKQSYSIIIGAEKFLKFCLKCSQSQNQELKSDKPDKSNKPKPKQNQSSQSNLVCKSAFPPEVSVSISSTLITDLEKAIKEKKKIDFDVIKIYNSYPELMIFTEYDKYISRSVNLRAHQIMLIDEYAKNYNNKLACIYTAPIGSGKTTSIYGLISVLKAMNSLNKNTDDSIIFACKNRSVILQVAQICFVMGVEFGIGYSNKSSPSGYSISIHDRMSKKEFPLMIIAEPDVAYKILTDKSIKSVAERFTLFHDESTIGAEDAQSKELIDNMRLLTVCPNKTIISSGTFPELSALPVLDNLFKARNMRVVKITSTDVPITCDIYDFNGLHITPLVACQTSSDIKTLLARIETSASLSKMLSLQTGYNLWKKLSENKIDVGVYNFNTFFGDVDNFNTRSVVSYVKSLINILEKANDQIIASVCSSLSELGQSIKIDSQTLGAFKSSALFYGVTLIVNEEPLKFAQNTFNTNINTVKAYLAKLNISDISALLSKYEKFKISQDKQISLMDEKNRDYSLSSVTNYVKNSLHIPNSVHLGSNFSKDTILEPSYEYLTESIDDNLLFLLMVGVGVVFSLENLGESARKSMRTYRDVVLNMASNRKLAYIVSDKSISYGANYPIDNVVIDYSTDLSIQTVFQTIGRAGRIGKSWRAKAYLASKTAEQLKSFIRTDKDQTEIQNINTALSSLEKELKGGFLNKYDLYVDMYASNKAMYLNLK